MRFFLVFFVYLSITFFDVWLKKAGNGDESFLKRLLTVVSRTVEGNLAEMGKWVRKKNKPCNEHHFRSLTWNKGCRCLFLIHSPYLPLPPSPLFYYYSKPFHYCFTNHSFADYKLGHLYKPIVLCHNVKYMLWRSSCSPLVVVKTRAYTLCLRGRQTSGHIIFLQFSLLRKLTQL